jgi:hypothetical protein
MLIERSHQVRDLREGDRKLCRSCGLLIFPDEYSQHLEHQVQSILTDKDLQHPTRLLPPLDNSKKEAQYLFKESTVKFLAETITKLGYKKVLCIGAPRVFEYLTNNEKALKPLLLDIDFRYGQFYDKKQFSRYNMFNHHFLEEGGDKVYRKFLSRAQPGELVILTDPPFGGLVEPLAHTMKKVQSDYQEQHMDLGEKKAELPVLWIFPYFMEPRLLQSLPSLTMLDYKVDYDNHPLSNPKNKARLGKKGSPVRIFTNIEPIKVVLPSHGYRLCKPCRRYVATDNQHCKKCRDCTAKDGGSYVHCDKCKKCVKRSRAHCDVCGTCQLEPHTCGNLPNACHICGDPSHKRKLCPNKRHKRETKKSKKMRIK